MSTERKAIAIIAVCLIVMGIGLYFLRDREAPAKVNRERLSGLRLAIEEWTETHGSPPKSLEELGLSDEAISDRAGTVFNYVVSDDGAVTLISYGADGKPGGLVFHSDTKITFQAKPSGVTE